MVYFLVLWGKENKGKYFAWALFVYAIGCNVFLEFLPAILAFQAVWLKTRAKISFAPLCLALIASTMVWYSYLRLEFSNNFFDIRVQLLPQITGSTTHSSNRTLDKYADDLESWDEETNALTAFTPQKVDELSGVSARLKKYILSSSVHVRQFDWIDVLQKYARAISRPNIFGMHYWIYDAISEALWINRLVH